MRTKDEQRALVAARPREDASAEKRPGPQLKDHKNASPPLWPLNASL
jgi:hypothetical protein